MNSYRILFYFFAFSLFFISCGEEQGERLTFKKQGNEVPDFNADSAYHFVEQQLAFGARDPNSAGHENTKNYLLDKLRTYAGIRSVYPQNFNETGYDGDTLALTNIIASFNPQSSDRIMFCAHWDTRPRADKDSKNKNEPIPGADDGASGVAVLLEMARLFEQYSPPIGVDIVLFDGEDYGREGDLQKYFLGSRYWAENPPVKGYSPRFGILLDMVGGQGAQFPKEGYSMQFAPALVNEIWAIAKEEGYEDLFIAEQGNRISDDHVVINRILGIPTIDVIRHDVHSDGAQFAPYWHTHGDDLSIINKNTLEGVGQVMVELVYNRLKTSGTNSN